ncbi:11735_t:CDS:1, partial [Acaulospora colombiana]
KHILLANRALVVISTQQQTVECQMSRTGPKRQCASHSKPQRLTSPCCLLRLPTELLIFTAKSTAHPGDILSLAYTCKQLYQLLAHKNSEYIWKYAREHMMLVIDLAIKLPSEYGSNADSFAEYVDADWKHWPIPPPLPGQTEICLAQLLFGRKTCPYCKKEHRDIPQDLVLGITL